jgi:hypothetical protein
MIGVFIRTLIFLTLTPTKAAASPLRVLERVSESSGSRRNGWL